MSSSTQQADLYLPGGIRADMASKLSKQASWRLYRLALILNDVLGIVVGFRAAYWVRFELALPFFQLDANSSPPLYSALVLTLIPLWLAIFAATGLYLHKNLLGGTLEYQLLRTGLYHRARMAGGLAADIPGHCRRSLLVPAGYLHHA